jgi:hypothetical protein
MCRGGGFTILAGDIAVCCWPGVTIAVLYYLRLLLLYSHQSTKVCHIIALNLE